MDKLTVKSQFGGTGGAVEADIKVLRSSDHEWLLEMFQERIEDRWLLWLIKKWLKAGVLEEDGQVIHPQRNPAGGNHFTGVGQHPHYCLDAWFHRVVRKYCRGEACLIRYADDRFTLLSIKKMRNASAGF